MKFWVALAAAASLAGGAHAQTAQLADLKCMVAISAAQSDAKPEDQAGMEAGTMYFAGKLNGRDPRFDYAAAVGAAAQALDAMNMRAELQRCGAELEALAKAMDVATAKLDDPKAM
jgi:hypothetical protein